MLVTTMAAYDDNNDDDYDGDGAMSCGANRI